MEQSTDRSLGSALLDVWPSYLAYVTSFLPIGIIWMNHHHCLMTVAFLPFTTKLVADYLQRPGEREAVIAYAATFVVMGSPTTAGGATRAAGAG